MAGYGITTMLKIYNSLTKQKEIFVPVEPGKVGIYVCGMTVYDFCHLGHARVLVVFDVVVRYLRSLGYQVTYIRNITDIDDKIIQRALDNGESFEDLTDRFIRAMQEDCAALSVLEPDVAPRATRSIDNIIEVISVLIDKGHAYLADNGDVYYDINSFSSYGCFSGGCADDPCAVARVEDVHQAKNNPLDFVLWKAAKPGEPSWDSPWGKGRPGWHIECSAMAMRHLGEHFDIHGGGMDLKFPHHENEIAQSEAATGRKFVNIWMHNGFVRVNEEKMSKSLGNFFTVREILARYRPEEVRYFILASHYRSPLNYSNENLDQARSALYRLYTALRGHESAENAKFEETYVERFTAAMDDDFNTAEALSVLFDAANACNRIRSVDVVRAGRLAATLCHLGGLLGILQENPYLYLQGTTLGTNNRHTDRAVIEYLIKQRDEARLEKRWQESDRIRDLLKGQGIVLEDGEEGTTWRCQI